MMANDLIAELGWLIREHGNLPIVGGDIADDLPPERVAVVDSGGREIDEERAGSATGFFLVSV